MTPKINISPKQSASSRGNILVVDDTPANLRFLADMLAKKGYKVRPAPNGPLALRSARSTPPDLILLDVLMPGMDGYELCEQLKVDERTRHIPVIFVSVLDEVLDKVKAFSVGGVDYVTKPIQEEEVLARVETHLALKTLQQGLEEKNEQLLQEIAERKRAEESLRQAYAEAERRLKEQTALQAAGVIISSSLDLHTVLTHLAEQICEAIDGTSSYILSYDAELAIQTVVAEYYSPEASAKEQVSDLGVTYEIEDSPSYVRAGMPEQYHVDDLDLSEKDRTILQKYEGQSVLDFTVQLRSQTVAYVELWDSRRRRTFTPAEIALCKSIARQAAIAIKHAELFEQAQQEIAERRRAEVALQKAKEVAETANQAKILFLNRVSHELRTPLTVILGYIEMMVLQDEAASNESLSLEQQRRLGLISKSGEQLLTIVNDILDMSKIEAGRTMLNKENFDLRYLLDDLETVFQLRARDKRLRFAFKCMPGVPQYIGTDRAKLRQVLMKLLDNAIKFTEAGFVSLRVSFKQGDEEASPHSQEQGITSSPPPHTPLLYFEVEDTGPGIPPDEIDTLFEPFVQSKIRWPQGGVGLGLSISRSYIKLMGGEITVSSPPLSHSSSIIRTEENLNPTPLPDEGHIEPSQNVELSKTSSGTLFEFYIRVSLTETADIEPKQVRYSTNQSMRIFAEADSQSELSPDVLAPLPADWQAALNYAATLADSEMALKLIGHIEADHPRLAKDLVTLVVYSQFDKLGTLINSPHHNK